MPETDRERRSTGLENGLVNLGSCVSFSLSAIMLAYNEGQHLAQVVGETMSGLEAHLDDFELIVVDDGSSDDTPQILAGLAETYKSLKVVTHPQNRGIGEAVHTGYAEATKEYALLLPADGQITLSQYVNLFGAIEDGADMVIARYKQRGEVDSTLRMFLSGGVRLLVWTVLGVGRKLDSAFIFRRSLLDDFPLTTRSFFVNLELPIRALRGDYVVVEVPMEVFPRISGDSKVVNAGRIRRVMTDIGLLRLQLWRESLARLGGRTSG